MTQNFITPHIAKKYKYLFPFKTDWVSVFCKEARQNHIPAWVCQWNSYFHGTAWSWCGQWGIFVSYRPRSVILKLFLWARLHLYYLLSWVQVSLCGSEELSLLLAFQMCTSERAVGNLARNTVWRGSTKIIKRKAASDINLGVDNWDPLTVKQFLAIHLSCPFPAAGSRFQASLQIYIKHVTCS